MTVIFVKNPTTLTELNTEQLTFRPIVVQCSTIDADVMLARLKQDIAECKPINELELVYLPLFNSIKFSPTELFLESIGLIKNLQQLNDDSKRKLYALTALLAGKVADKGIIKAFLMEVEMVGNAIFEAMEEIGEERGAERRQEEIAVGMLQEGYKLSEIIKLTGVDLDRLEELLMESHSPNQR